MGFQSLIQITAESAAADLFVKALEPVKPQVDSGLEGVTVITLDWCKWYPYFSEVSRVNELVEFLDAGNYNDKEGYGYKMVILNEDDTNEVFFNDRGLEIFPDFGVQVYISNPYLG